MSFDADGTCSMCRDYDAVREQAQQYFRTVEDLLAIRDRALPAGAAATTCCTCCPAARIPPTRSTAWWSLGFDVVRAPRSTTGSSPSRPRTTSGVPWPTWAWSTRSPPPTP
ncbi:MAG: hypothetical protein R2755_17670 [Acidimicrobiales bacterium]